jgi:hypothetical protein
MTIRAKALLLSLIFTGNSLVVCHCSATAAGASSSGSAFPHGHCCCSQKAAPCKDRSDCPGTQAVKFHLLEKKAAASVRLSPAHVEVITRDYFVPVVEGRLAQQSYPSLYLHPHSPPDRLALHQCYLI